MKRDFYFLSFPIPKPAFFSSIEEFFIGELVFADIIARDESTSLLTYIFDELGIDRLDLIVLQSVPIWRIGDDDPLRYWASHVVSDRESDISIHSCSLCVGSCYSYHLRIYICPCDGIFATWIDLAASRILHLLQQPTIVESELFNSELASKPRGYIASDHDRLDRYRTRSTHRIREGSCVLPISERYECGCEIFFEWCLSCLTSVSTLVEWISRDIEEDMSHVVDDEDEYMYLDPVGYIGSIHRGEYRPLTHTLDRRCMLESRPGWCCLDYDPLFAREIVGPLEPVESIIERIEVLDFRICQLDIYSIGESASYEELVHILICPSTWYESISGDYLGTTDPVTFSLHEWL